LLLYLNTSSPDMGNAGLREMLSIFPVLGVTAFEPPPPPALSGDQLTVTGAGVTARGYDSPQGFVVRVGSQARVEEADKIPPSLAAHRAELCEQGVLAKRGEHYEFTQDHVFGSPSSAAGVVLGRSANGRTEWRDDRNRPLRQIQEQDGGEGGEEKDRSDVTEV